MQDTAEGFGQPIRHLFEPFFAMKRGLPSPFDPAPRYRVVIGDRFWNALYAPLAPLVQRLSGGFARLQQGSIALYLLYGFGTLVVLLAPGALNTIEWFTQVLEVMAALAAAPLFLGWVNQCRAWLQDRRAPSVLQPYRQIRKLFHKETVVAESASPPLPARALRGVRHHARRRRIIPSMGTRLPFTSAADAIALVGLFATARVFMSLAAMDIGTAFGSFGARREMMVGFLAEPALLMVIFVASLISLTTALPLISERLATLSFALSPSLAFTAVAFTMVLLAENGRIPIDNPATHLELTMIHEAMLLEYSGRHLALMELANALKLFNYACMGFALFIPWGEAMGEAGPRELLTSIPVLGLKLAASGFALALIETVSAKLRVFRAPEFLATAFLFAALGLLVHLLLGA